jgi:ADP-ribosyl-[dinitrogen reductase] hydrolase
MDESKPLQGASMIDLRSPDAVLSEYAQRYIDLVPDVSPQLQQRMEYIYDPDAPILPRIKPAWLSDRPCTLSREQSLDRAQGALLGLAIGDAVGTTLEFQRRGQGQVTDMVGGGPFRLAPGQWTDDTSMALCLADTYEAKGRFDFATFADALVRWYRQGENSVNGRCFDIGNVTRRALEGWETEGLA